MAEFGRAAAIFDCDAGVLLAPPKAEDATLLMVGAAGGDKGATDRLVPLVYEQPRAAQNCLRSER